MRRKSGNIDIKGTVAGRIRYGWLLLLLLMIPRGCIEPYDPDIGEEEGIIVIEASLIKGEMMQEVVISRSSTFDDLPINPVSSCRVEIVDDLFNRYEFWEAGEGRYAAYIPDDQLSYNRVYQVKVVTPEGDYYESSYESIEPGAAVDSVYYAVETSYDKIIGENVTGVQFYLDLLAPDTITRYFRWKMEETYEYTSIAPITSIMGGPEPGPPRYFKQYYRCWRTAGIRNLFLSNTANLVVNEKKRIPLNFVSNRTNRLAIGYSLLAKQYSISEDAFYYWLKAKEETHNSGGLYTRQPGGPITNFCNIGDTTDVVLGYFWTASVTEQRIFVPKIDTLRILDHACEMVPYNPLFHADGPFPRYLYMDPMTGVLMTGESRCFDCRERGGELDPPDFWELK